MNNDQIDNAKGTISTCICDLIQIAEHADDRNLVNKLKAQKLLLDGLDERIERSQLPDGFVRSVINDVRLDVLMIYGDLKFLFTLKKQEAAAPTEKLKQQAHNRLAEYKGQTLQPVEIAIFSSTERLPEIEQTLNKLKEIEHHLHESLL
jgi:hypothetical protein